MNEIAWASPSRRVTRYCDRLHRYRGYCKDHDEPSATVRRPLLSITEIREKRKCDLTYDFRDNVPYGCTQVEQIAETKFVARVVASPRALSLSVLLYSRHHRRTDDGQRLIQPLKLDNEENRRVSGSLGT